MAPDRWMLSISSSSASLPFVRNAIGIPLISLTMMRGLDVVFDVSLNKLLNKPSYDFTVMDDLASLFSAHCLPVYLKQSCKHKFVDAAKTDRIKEVTYQINVCVYNNCWYNVLFSERYGIGNWRCESIRNMLVFVRICYDFSHIYGWIKHISLSWWKRCCR